MNTQNIDDAYAGLVDRVMREGEAVETRGHNCKRLFWVPLTLTSTPLVSARKAAWRLALREMEWFLSGSSSIRDLHPSVRHWWEPWADKTSGEVSYNYSYQFRRATSPLGPGSFDQIRYLVEGIKDHPHSRRLCISTWDTAEMTGFPYPACPISNCHGSWLQACVGADGETLSLGMLQRSADLICGVPHNLVQYWAFLLWLCAMTGKRPGRLEWLGADVHVYLQHSYLAGLIIGTHRAHKLLRAPYADKEVTPQLTYKGHPGDAFKADDFELDAVYAPLVVERAEMVV